VTTLERADQVYGLLAAAPLMRPTDGLKKTLSSPRNRHALPFFPYAKGVVNALFFPFTGPYPTHGLLTGFDAVALG
jgi:hypothetical protein